MIQDVLGQTLTEHLKRTRCSVLSPLQGLSLGTRVSRLRKLNFEDDLAQEYLQFHMALKRLYVGQSGGQSWSRLSEQNFRVDKWSICRG
jgi:hypothetical protein